MEIDGVISLAKAHLDLLEVGDHDPVLRAYVNEGGRQLFDTDTYIIKCKIEEIDCNSISMPSYQELLCFKFLDANKEELTVHNCSSNGTICGCQPFWSFDANVLSACSSCGCGCCSAENNFYIQNGTMTIPSWAADQATFIKLYYVGLNTDDDGLIVVNDNQALGLSFYAAALFAISRPQRYTPFQQQNFWQHWVAQFNRINGSAVIKRAKLKEPEIRLIMNSIIWNPPVKNFLGA